MVTLKILTINYLYIVNLSTGTVIISSNNAIKQNFVFCDCGAILGLRRPCAALELDCPGSRIKPVNSQTKRRRIAALQSQAKAPDKNTKAGRLTVLYHSIP
jgi:hypothetical protein